MSVPSRHVLNGSEWTIHPTSPERFAVDGVIPARVPGNVQDDLERAGLLAPLSVGLGDPRWHDVALTGWRYERRVTVAPAPRQFLTFDGVDFSCRVSIDGVEVAAHAGMFRRFTVEITDAVAGRDSVLLHVDIDPMPEQLLPVLEAADGAQSGAETAGFFVFANNEIRRTLKDLKSPATCSYDWATNTWALGIWRDVEHRGTGPARIDELRVDADVSAERAALTVSVALDLGDTPASSAPVAVEVDVIAPDGATVATGRTDALDGHAALHLEVARPERWWPVGHGAQPLYRVEARAVTGDGAISDRAERRVGLREVRWEQVDGVEEGFINPFMLVINGRRVRTMGSNIVSPDLLFGRNERSGDWFIRAAVEAGMNAVRVHGGGVTLPPAMYDLADELGLLILHEFPVGNCLMEDDPVFLENLDATVRSIVRQLRHHPSIIEWSGGNELHWLQRDDYPALETMRRAIAAEDTRLFRATCPMEGSRHSPWHYDHEWFYAHYDDTSMTDNLGENPLMRYGEFGTQTPALLDVWERDIPEASRWPLAAADDPVLVRKNATNAVFSDDFWLTVPLTEEMFGTSRSLPDLLRAGQFLGAEGIRYAVDALRARGGALGGFTTWDFNEPWSNAAGSFLIDHGGRAVMAFDFFAQAMAPTVASLAYDDLLHEPGTTFVASVRVVSDAADTVQAVGWEVETFDITGRSLARETGEEVDLSPQQAEKVATVSLVQPVDGSPLLVRVATLVGGERVAERLHVFGASGVRAPLAALLPAGRQPHADLIAAAGVEPANADNRAWSGNGGRVHAVSGAEVRDHDPVAGLIDGRYCTPRDGFGSGAVWQSPTREGWFVLRPAPGSTGITRIVLGRDRSGTHGDRTLDRLAVEVSDDAQSWTRIVEVDRLASLLGDRPRTSEERSNPGLGEQLGRRSAYRPAWSLEVHVPETRAEYWRFVVSGRDDTERFVAFDEVELYADPAVRVDAPGLLVRDHRELDHALTTTRLRAERGEQSVDATGLRTVPVTIHNDGDALALFCEITGPDGSRPRVFGRGANVSVPPGQSREIVLAAGDEDEAWERATWEVRAWNAPPIPVAPATETH